MSSGILYGDEVKELSVGEKQSGLKKNDFRLGFPLFYL